MHFTFLSSLRSAEENQSKIKTDTLQRLHTVTNLAELLDAGHEGIPPTLRDQKLKDEAEELKDKYLVKYSTAVAAAQVTISSMA